MRLTDVERVDIASAAAVVLPAGSRVSLFGSRVDDARRGGDVDLLVELPGAPSPDDIVRMRSRLTAQLYRRWGERRIDLLMCLQDQPDARPVVDTARRDGVLIAQV